MSTGYFDQISPLNVCLNCLLFFMARLTQHGVWIFFNLTLAFTLLPLDSISLNMDQFRANSFTSSIHRCGVRSEAGWALGAGRQPTRQQEATKGDRSSHSLFRLPLWFPLIFDAQTMLGPVTSSSSQSRLGLLRGADGEVPRTAGVPMSFWGRTTHY